MKKTILYLGSITVLCFFTQSCEKSNENYPETVKSNFITACLESSGGKYTACECLFNKVSKEYSYEEYVDLETRMIQGEYVGDYYAFVESVKAECN
ncbi:hypothetical protein GO491_07175 [Flavobacteriaceae bacterium Ap0902]|nr:hypothetical protein [Flavobacteriaceae bacterium Ap0902]